MKRYFPVVVVAFLLFNTLTLDARNGRDMELLTTLRESTISVKEALKLASYKPHDRKVMERTYKLIALYLLQTDKSIKELRGRTAAIALLKSIYPDYRTSDPNELRNRIEIILLAIEAAMDSVHRR